MCACFQLGAGSWQVGGLELGNHPTSGEGTNMAHLLRRLWAQEDGQDIAEYAVMLAVILILVIGTIRLVGGNANNAFSAVASSIQ